MIPDPLIRFFAGRRIAILGFGMEGRSSLRFLQKHLPGLQVHVCDQNPHADNILLPGIRPEKVSWFLGRDYLNGLRGVDLVLRSPGVPFHALGEWQGRLEISSQTAVFTRFFHDRMVGITGTKGKSTTASLIHHLFRAAGRPAVLAGNIGFPYFDLLAMLQPDSFVVAEMSSHQLEDIRHSPQTAILLNLFPEHLDHYSSFEAYGEAKKNIARWQDEKAFFILNATSTYLSHLAEEASFRGQRIFLQEERPGHFFSGFEGDDLLVRLPGGATRIKDARRRSQLPGKHNEINLAAAVAVACLHGLPAEVVADAIADFRGLPHRLEVLGKHRESLFVNDSISTVPESTMEAVQAFPQPGVLMLGGFDRGLPYEALLDFIGQSAVHTLVFFGPAGRRLRDMARRSPSMVHKTSLFATGFDQAFHLAQGATGKGEVCLLSPAAASYDGFRDFAERGERFRQLFQELKGREKE